MTSFTHIDANGIEWVINAEQNSTCWIATNCLDAAARDVRAHSVASAISAIERFVRHS